MVKVCNVIYHQFMAICIGIGGALFSGKPLSTLFWITRQIAWIHGPPEALACLEMSLYELRSFISDEIVGLQLGFCNQNYFPSVKNAHPVVAMDWTTPYVWKSKEGRSDSRWTVAHTSDVNLPIMGQVLQKKGHLDFWQQRVSTKECSGFSLHVRLITMP